MIMRKPNNCEYELANRLSKKNAKDCDKYTSCKDCPYWNDGYETHCKMVWVIQNLDTIVDWDNRMCRGWNDQVKEPIDFANIISNSVEKHGLNLKECEIDLIAEDLMDELRKM